MKGEKLITKIQNPMQIGKKEVADMRISLQAFPYFSTMQLLYAKGLYNTDSISYNGQLRKAAAHAGNRKLLFQLITKNIKEVEEVSEKKLEHLAERKDEIVEKESPEKELQIGKPLHFSEDETHSFSEWLSIT